MLKFDKLDRSLEQFIRSISIMKYETKINNLNKCSLERVEILLR